MPVPREVYPLKAQIENFLPELRPAQQAGLALWVFGTILAHSGCQTSVVCALLSFLGSAQSLRQRLRDWLHDGKDKATPCQSEVDVGVCLVGLLRWIVSCWKGEEIALAIGTTTLRDRITALVVSVLCQGSAIPVAWKLLPGAGEGKWMRAYLRLLRKLKEAVPPSFRVLVLADRGLWSPRLFFCVERLEWFPLLRI